MSVFVSFGVAEIKNARQLKFIMLYIMFKIQFVLYNDKVLLALSHHTEFVQTVLKGVS